MTDDELNQMAVEIVKEQRRIVLRRFHLSEELIECDPAVVAPDLACTTPILAALQRVQRAQRQVDAELALAEQVQLSPCLSVDTYDAAYNQGCQDAATAIRAEILDARPGVEEAPRDGE